MKRAFLALGFLAAAVLAPAAPSQADDFKAEVKYAQVGDVKLAYYTRGEGKPLVMINGFISTMSLWDPRLIAELSKNRQLIMFDNRGAGMSTDTVENFTTIPQMADDAAGLIKALGLKQPDILGWSMGARIAQQVVIRHPDVVGKVVLVAPNPGGSKSVPASKDVEEKLNDPNVSLEGKLGLAFPPEVGGVKAAEEIFKSITDAGKAGISPNDFNVSKQTLERQNAARTTLWSSDETNFEDLKNIKNQVLVTGGRFDLIDPPANSLLIAQQIPFAWLAFYDGGHAFLFQQYKQFAATVEAFLQAPEPTP